MAVKFLIASAMAMAVRQVPYYVPVRSGPLVAQSIDNLDMQAAPIDPSWVLSGAPKARLALHSRSNDDAATTAVWDCTAGEFRWYFGWDETVVILEGSVHVTAEDGSEQTLRAGDIGYFSGDTWATWRIDDYVRKVAFCRKQFPAPIALAYKVRDMLRGGLRGGLAA